MVVESNECVSNSQQERPCIFIQVAGIKRNWEAYMKGEEWQVRHTYGSKLIIKIVHERDGRGGSVARKVLARMWLNEQKQLMDRLGVCKGSERD